MHPGHAAETRVGVDTDTDTRLLYGADVDCTASRHRKRDTKKDEKKTFLSLDEKENCVLW